MIGAIIGDIVGSIYEFDNIKTKDFELLTKNVYLQTIMFLLLQLRMLLCSLRKLPTMTNSSLY